MSAGVRDRREKGGGLTAGDTKTYAGTRKITLPPSVTAILRERKKTALAEWIFPNPLCLKPPASPASTYYQMNGFVM